MKKLLLLFALLLASVGYAVAQGPGPVPTFITCGTGLTCAPTNPINGIGTISQTSPGVTSVGSGACLTGGPITTTGTLSGAAGVDRRTTTSEAIVNGDQCKLVTFNNASPVAATIPQAGVGGLFNSFWSAQFLNLGTGAVTITPTTSTINGAATLVLLTGQGCGVYSDGSNYEAQCGQAPLTPTLIQTLTSAGPNYTFTVPGSIDSADIHFNGMWTTSGGGHNVALQFNGDSGSNYRYEAIYQATNNGLPGAFYSNSDTSMFIFGGITAGFGTRAPFNGLLHIAGLQADGSNNLPYSGPAVTWQVSGQDFSVGYQVRTNGGGQYSTLSSITSITVLFPGSSVAAVSLWGYPGE